MPGVDDTDLAILRVLQRDGRASMTAIAEAVHISRAGAHARIARMTETGVIRGYGVRTDPVSLGLHSSAYVSVAIEQASWHEVSESLRAIREVEHIALVGGDFDVLMLVRARDAKDLRRIVLEEVQSIPGVRTSRTTLIFEDYSRD